MKRLLYLIAFMPSLCFSATPFFAGTAANALHANIADKLTAGTTTVAATGLVSGTYNYYGANPVTMNAQNAITAGTCTGNAATATTATNSTQLNGHADTYFATQTGLNAVQVSTVTAGVQVPSIAQYNSTALSTGSLELQLVAVSTSAVSKKGDTMQGDLDLATASKDVYACNLQADNVLYVPAIYGVDSSNHGSGIFMQVLTGSVGLTIDVINGYGSDLGVVAKFDNAGNVFFRNLSMSGASIYNNNYYSYSGSSVTFYNQVFSTNGFVGNISGNATTATSATTATTATTATNLNSATVAAYENVRAGTATVSLSCSGSAASVLGSGVSGNISGNAANITGNLATSQIATGTNENVRVGTATYSLNADTLDLQQGSYYAVKSDVITSTASLQSQITSVVLSTSSPTVLYSSTNTWTGGNTFTQPIVAQSSMTVYGSIYNPGGTVQTKTLIEKGLHPDNSNSTYKEITSNWRLSFTPKFSNSILILRCQFNVNNPNDHFIRHFKFFDITHSTDVCVGPYGTATSDTVAIRFAAYDVNDSQPVTMMGIVNANDTTPRTYGVWFRKENAGSGAYTVFNYSSSLNNEAGWTAPFVFTIEEIAQ